MNTDKQHSEKLGRHMLSIFWVLVLVALTFFFGLWEKEQYNPNSNPDSLQTQQYTEVILRANAGNHYISTGKINNKEVVFLLDTGATHVAIPAEMATKLQLKPGYKSRVTTANGTVEVRNTVIKHLQLGDITLTNVRAALNPGMRGNEVLLGMSALKHLEFTQSGKTLTIRHYHR